MDYFGCYRHLVSSQFQVNSTFRNIFTGKNGDVFNVYFTRCRYAWAVINVKKKIIIILVLSID